MKKIVVSMIFAFTAIIMSGCSSSSDSTPATAVLSGTAATGAPIDGTVYVKDAKGVEKSVATAADGSFTLDVPDMTPPYLLKIRTAAGTDLYSFASENGQTVNLTPITNLAMFLAYGKKDLNDLYSAWDGTGMSSAQVDDAEGVVRANLESQIKAKGIDAASFNLFTSAFKADGSGIDGLMDELKITVDPVDGYSFTDVDGNPVTMTFDENIAPIAPASAIQIATVSGGTHALNGTYKTVCYSENGVDSRIDSVTINDGYEWVNRTFIYPGQATTCTGVPKIGTILATITKGSDKQISGWDSGMGGAPEQLDGSGLISDTVTVTEFTLTDFVKEDPDDVVGFPPPGEAFPASITSFYVFDDTDTSGGFAMYRDRDATTAGKSDPYVMR